MMNNQRIEELIPVYRDGLLNDTVPFWTEHAVDRECGGFLFFLDRDGSVIGTDKPVWIHGRFVWLLSTLYATVEQRPEWLDLAKHGVDFLREHCFDDDGRMFFLVSREGKPLRKRRYLFSECFATIALAAYARAAGDAGAAKEALDLYKLILRYHTTPGLLEPKWIDENRPSKGIVMPMILTATAQELRLAIDDPVCKEWIDRSIDEIERDFLKPDLESTLEIVGPNGEFMDTFEGRTINPGHAIEAAWFLLHEAKLRGNDPRIMKLGLTILDWMWKRGWDEEHGGLFYFRDVKGLPCTEYWHDMKFWWPHNEAIIATLLAHSMTGDDKYASWHRTVHDWAYAHFPDRQFGEWFGYLHRDGSLSTPLKGNVWKGPFHLPRMQFYCWKLLEEMRGA
jgi:N-acylglucosamine 2-epimerase